MSKIRLTVSIEQESMDQLRTVATDANRTMSDVVECAIGELLEAPAIFLAKSHTRRQQNRESEV